MFENTISQKIITFAKLYFFVKKNYIFKNNVKIANVDVIKK